MALHYFHISNGHTTFDDHGTDVSTITDVRRVAMRAAYELLNLGYDDRLWDGKPWRVWATDQPGGAGRTIATIEMSGTSPA